jgi:GT2 family glycosyltransferase
MKKKQNTDNLQPDIALLKDKVKYFLAIRKSLLHTKDVSTSNYPGNSGSTNSISKNVTAAIKYLYSVMPSFVLNNIITRQLIRLCIVLINHLEARIKSKAVNPLSLFEQDLPTTFDMPGIDENPTVSIVIPVHNKYHYTHRCLYSILKNSSGINYEIIIADDASSDETKLIGTNVKNIKVARNESSLGFLGNCNNAALLAEGKYLLLLNNDTVVQPNWLNALLNTIENNDSIGMVGSKLVYPEGVLQEAGGIVWSDGSGWNYGKLGVPDAAEYNYVKEVDYISGAAVMLRADLWKQLGGFDTRYTPAYYEDTDLAFEVRKLGFKVVYQPLSVVVHFEGISHGTDTGSGIKKYQLINQQKFIDKWKNTLEQEQSPNEQFLFKARDRSRHKKTMLFIDHHVPEFDKDAGSKSCFQYLNLFVKMGINVKFIGDDYLQREPYTSTLQQLGIEVLYGSEYQQGWQSWVNKNSEYIDWVFFNRPFVTAKYINFIKANTQAKLIYFGHDLHYIREERQYSITHDKQLLKSAQNWKKMEWDIFSKSDVVLYPSNEEINIIHQQDAQLNAHVLPLSIFENATAYSEKYDLLNKSDLLFVGGFNHPPNEDAVLWFANEIFPLILAKNPQIKFNIVGSKVTAAINQLASPQIIVKGFVSDEKLKQLYKSCRVVVAPLRYGAGVKGKIIEAVYHQCAIVTTPIGIEGIENTEQLITVAQTPSEFAQAVLDLYNNDERIAQIYERSPDYIAAHFSEKRIMEYVKNTIL